MDKKEKDKLYYAANREARLKSISRYREDNLDNIREKDRIRGEHRRQSESYQSKKRIARLASLYDISKEHAKDLYERSHGMCEVCGDIWDSSKHKHSFSVDHNHFTGEVRGILCHHCNTALGHLKENTNIMLSLIEYTRKHNGTV